MGGIVELAEPIIEVREVVETFRVHQIVVAGWDEVIRAAIAALTAFERSQSTPPQVARMAAELDLLLRVGIDADADLIDQLSTQTAELMSMVVPATIPGPDDEQRWAFPQK